MQPNAFGNRERYVQDKTGAALIEFAIVFPICLLLILAIIELSLIYWGNSMLDNALLQASRQSMVGCVRDDCTNGIVTHDSLLALMENKTSGFIRRERLCLTAVTVGGGQTLGQGSQVTTITLNYQWPVFNPFIVMTNAFGLTNDWIDYTSSTAVRNEPFTQLLSGRDVPSC